MPMFTASNSWQSVTLTTDEIWQLRSPVWQCLLTVETPTSAADLRGIRLQDGEVRVFRAGQTVSWRTAVPALPPGAECILHREVYA